MVEIHDLYAGYGSKHVLKGLNLTVIKGEVTAIVGPNGCGKSTLLKVLCGILPPAAGEIRINGIYLNDYSRRELAKTVSFLPQNRNIPEINVERMVLHGRFPYLSYPRNYRQADRQIANDCMEKMGLSGLRDQPLGKLSGGMRQKVYIAMALAQDTDLILMDEPTTYLDISHQFQVLQQSSDLASSGKAVVIVLHDLSTALQFADKIAVMDAGRICNVGCAEDIFESRCLDSIFHIKLNRFKTNSGWQYYYERG